jgi:trk system potassium uptake protein TrkH
MLITVLVSLYYRENEAFKILNAGLITMGFGLILWFFTRNAEKSLNKKDGYLIVTFGWIVLTITGALPYILTHDIPEFTDAFFESVSGYSTTGASILTDVESMTKGMLFWRSATQWIGGMGIIVMAIAVLPLLGIGGMQLFMAEAPGPTADKLHPRIKETAKRLWLIYFTLTAMESILLKVAGVEWFDAICHSMTTMSTGGFSTKNASIAYWDGLPWVQNIITVFMFVAGTNFLLSYFVYKGKIRKVVSNEEFRFYFLITISVITVILGSFIFLSGHATDPVINSESAGKTISDVAFQVTSIITTTGFVVTDYTLWNTFAVFLMFLMFFIGGSAGSTAGGIKVVRHLIIFKNAILEFKKILHPGAIIPVRYNGMGVRGRVVYNILAFFAIYLLIFVISSIVFSSMGIDFITATGASASALGNIGPAFGELGPMDNYAWLAAGGKIFAGFLMLIGRLELFTVLVILTPFFWKNN